MNNIISVAIIIIPGTAQSAVYGLIDLFQSANRILSEMQPDTNVAFKISRWKVEKECLVSLDDSCSPLLVIVPPVLEGQAYLDKQGDLCRQLSTWHQQGATISSACAGAFLLAQAGMLQGRKATTHWQLERLFRQHYPTIELDINALLISDPDVITAGGVMSWMDLGLHLISRYVPSTVVQALGRFLLVDIGPRQQGFYRSFLPIMNHHDNAILTAQHLIHRGFSGPLLVENLAQEANLTERTFLRRFQKATGLTPSEYIQQFRVHKARELLENSTTTVDQIAWMIGYEDVSAFRRMFHKQTGLTPSQYRSRSGHKS
ncbi:helix-turn-helix domain-containing protein [Neptunomonas phycophila]|uniref:Helix-turn-helix domain-containing protein n=1 Tax=Neptunomonas phycophila TaxID=1572645 RepID=A0AAW7XFL6_9GAMM|nr:MULTISPECIES: helix-turn-helix domain-containing protein [Neptunomonas]MBT3145689.1 helix-turn-helix domain-containing protein [Neptunomonas phycophila]MDN2660181.1 helix-turn-helix domain-containing protein [Neptunomonas sp. CHC150]MDO6453206.1 helix-turn-helix domain-containing protein [Neptunomonas phycophila]MDO6784351.1 helix-turn-helix domain-containing protein [Neptunomonas phycophila]